MDTTVPAHIQAAMDQAAQLQDQLYGEKPAAPTEPVANTDPPPADPPTAYPAPPVAPPVEPVTPEPPKSSENFEAKYKVLEGKYRNEVPLLHQQLRELRGQLQELQRQAKPAEQPAVEEPALVTEKDVEEYGKDLVDMVRRACRDEIGRASKALLAKVEERVGRVMAQLDEVQGRVVKSEEEQFWDRVRTLVPDWSEVDENQSWIDFLNTTPEFSERTYRDLAGEAISAGSAQKIAKLVAIWRGEQPAQPVVEPAPQVVKPDLQRQVAPSTTKSSTPPAAKRTYTQADYEYAFSQKATREMAPKALEQLQQDVQTALAEGRVRW